MTDERQLKLACQRCGLLTFVKSKHVACFDKFVCSSFGHQVITKSNHVINFQTPQPFDFFYLADAGNNILMHVTEGPFHRTIASTTKRLFIQPFHAGWEDEQKVASFFWRQNLLAPSHPPTFSGSSHPLHRSFILVFHIGVLTLG